MTGCGCADDADQLERKTLRILLVINGLMFVVEAVVGWWAESTGLLADSLDMLADALVYGIALLAVARSVELKAKAALGSGILQIVLGLGVVSEVVRRFFYGSEPASLLMIVIGLIALVANVVCMMLLAKHRKGEVHMRASWIFSTNDVLANLGLILSGIMVSLLSSRYPDLIIGSVVAMLVIVGGCRIVLDANRGSLPAQSTE